MGPYNRLQDHDDLADKLQGILDDYRDAIGEAKTFERWQMMDKMSLALDVCDAKRTKMIGKLKGLITNLLDS